MASSGIRYCGASSERESCSLASRCQRKWCWNSHAYQRSSNARRGSERQCRQKGKDNKDGPKLRTSPSAPSCSSRPGPHAYAEQSSTMPTACASSHSEVSLATLRLNGAPAFTRAAHDKQRPRRQSLPGRRPAASAAESTEQPSGTCSVRLSPLLLHKVTSHPFGVERASEVERGRSASDMSVVSMRRIRGAIPIIPHTHLCERVQLCDLYTKYDPPQPRPQRGYHGNMVQYRRGTGPPVR